MNGPVALLHVVGGENVANLSELVEEVVLETEHGCRSHNCGLGVDFADDLLTPGLICHQHSSLRSCVLPVCTDLGSEILRGRVTAGVVRRNVNETVDIVLGNGVGNALNTVNVNVLVGEVPGTISNYPSIRTTLSKLTW